MANSLTTNPIVLDTFTSEIDLGDILYGDSKTVFFLNSIEWQNPTFVGDTFTVTDANGNPIFSVACAVANQSEIKYFFNQPVRGIKVPSVSDAVVPYVLWCQDEQFLLTEDGQAIFLATSTKSSYIEAVISYILSCQQDQFLLTENGQAIFIDEDDILLWLGKIVISLR